MAGLEAFCARLAATRLGNAALADLRQMNALCITSAKAQDAETYYEENERFHAVIYQASQNRFLEEATLRLLRRLRPYRRMQLTLRGRLGQSLSEHEQVLNALEDGDGNRATTAVREHVIVQGEKFHHIMNSLKQSRKMTAS